MLEKKSFRLVRLNQIVQSVDKQRQYPSIVDKKLNNLYQKPKICYIFIKKLATVNLIVAYSTFNYLYTPLGDNRSCFKKQRF